MFDWLFEGRSVVYYILGIATIVLLIVWKQVPRRGYLLGAGACILLLGLYWLLDRLVVTGREEVKATIQLMAASVAERNLDRAFEHFADDFQTSRGTTKAALRAIGDREISTGSVTRVAVWAFEIPGPVDRDQPVKASFRFTFEGVNTAQSIPYLCDAVFRFHPQHGWQMQSCRILNLVNEDEAFPI